MMGMERDDLLRFNQSVIEEFRANAGVCGGHLEGNNMILITTTGAKSGEPRVSPLTYFPDGERYVIMASAGGSPTHPNWYHNLTTHPEISVEVGGERFAATATTATGDERQRIFTAMVAAMPRFGEYQEQTEREIPVVVLTRR
jgi:deazaflavin-dependent oxidoreductase (nitroreductase family)